MASAQVVITDLSKIELLSDHSSIKAGDSFNIVIELEPNEGWHAYWVNPGDAGLKLEVAWDLPEGVEVGELQFSTPHLIPFEEIVSYGYDGKVTVTAEVKTPDNFESSQLTLAGDAFWLTCSDVLCVPQEAQISHTVLIGENVIDDRGEMLLKAAQEDTPDEANWPSQFHTDGENFTIISKIPDQYPVIESAYLFPRTIGMMENQYYQDLSFIDGNIVGRFKNAYGYSDEDQFEFVLSFKTGDGQDKAFSIVAQKSLIPVAEVRVQESTSPLTDLGIVTALGFAFLGGLILNLMPCVFPILSLKAMSVVELSGKDPKEVRLSGLLYTAGVLICFGLIGAVVSSLSIGWGFHMQMPVINFTLGLLMVAIGLNLLGVFEFGSSLMGLGQGLVSEGSVSKKRRSTFFTGFLAVVVATPCTAPFMAGALGFAFVKGGVIGMSVFLMLGFGLAFPYLLLCFVPVFRNILPRPGAWMETMRTILGFPMFATALWLFWILGNQAGVDALAIGVAASLLLGFALWGMSKTNITWKVVSVICVIGVIYSGFYLSNMKQSTALKDESSNAIAFSSDALQNLLIQDQAVFVYFTADWCVTCKLNERVALSQSEVQEAFVENNVTLMVGDWTNQNPDITKTLQSYGRIGVPLYLYFPEGRRLNNPDILPQILTPTTVIEAL
jgi:thiol:disulfide interchange protein/DsbC/DsbD-like thiol-disulfide interchange protein